MLPHSVPFHLDIVESDSARGHPSTLWVDQPPEWAPVSCVVGEDVASGLFVDLDCRCPYKSLATRTTPPTTNKKKWVESHPSSAGILHHLYNGAFS